MAIKNSILSSVNRAVSSNTQTPQERKQENLLTSINSNMRKVVKNGNKAIRDDKQKIHTKLLTGVRNTLDKIKKNTKPDSKGFGILKILLMIVGGLIIGATTKLFNTVKIFTKIIGFFGKIIKGFGSILSGGFTKLFGRLLKGPKALLLGFFGMFKKLGGIFKGPKALVLKLIGFFKSFGGIFKLLGKIGIFLAPVTMIVKKLVWPITLLMSLFDGLKGLSKASEWFGKEEATIGEKISAVFGNILSGLTFGLLGSGKEISKGLYKLFTKPKEFITKDIPKIVSGMGDRFVKGLSKIGESISTGFKKAIGFITGIDWGKLIVQVVDYIILGINKGVKLFTKFFPVIMAGISEALTKGFHLIVKYFPIVVTKLIEIIKNIDWVGLGLKAVKVFVFIEKQIIKILWTILKNLPSIIWTVVSNVVPLLVKVIDGVADLLFMGLKGLTGIVFEALKIIPKLIWGGIVALFETAMDVAPDVWDAMANWMRNLGGYIWGAIKHFFMNSPQDENKDIVVDGIIIWMKKLGAYIWGSIKKLFSSDGEDKSVVTTAMEALSGLKDMVIGGITGFINDIITGVKDIVKKITDIGGKVLAKVKDILHLGENKPQNTNTNIGSSSIDDIGKIETTSTPTKTKIKEMENIQDAGGVALSETSNDTEKQKLFMDFLLNQFADTMAKKIGAVQNNKDVSSIKAPTVKII